MTTEGREFSPRDEESSEETEDLLFAKRRPCFCIPRRRSPPSSTAGRKWWRRMREDEGTWWSRGMVALKKLREWSEIVAGPRWKTFIRRFNRCGGGGGRTAAKFQYDPMSYALNFDDGGQNGNSDKELGFRSFSCRYGTAQAATEKADVATAFG